MKIVFAPEERLLLRCFGYGVYGPLSLPGRTKTAHLHAGRVTIILSMVVPNMAARMTKLSMVGIVCPENHL